MEAARAWLAPTGSSTLGGIQFVFAPLADVLERLDEIDALVSFDVTMRDLPELAIESFIERGGGWLATSGDDLLDDWVPGDANDGLHGLLPLEPAPLDRGPRDVVLLVDGSGSMEGEPFETVRAACVDLIAAALPSDEVSLRFFTANLRAADVLKPRTASADEDVAGAGEAARRLLGLHVPSGDTHILAALESFAAERRATDRDSLALLLTDGREREWDPNPEERAARLLASLSEARASVRPIAVGSDADLEFLRRLTREGEEVFVPHDLDDLRAIFRREITGAQCREGASLALAWAAAAPGSIASDVRGTDPIELPPVTRFVKNVARPGAEVLWTADQGEPVLALQRVGLGRTAMFATVPGAGWAPRWTRRTGIGEPVRFANVLRWLARAPERAAEGPRLSFESTASGDRCSLTGLDESWPPVVRAEVLRGANRDALVVAELELHPPSIQGPSDPTLVRTALLPPDASPARHGDDEDRVLRVTGPDGSLWILPIERGLAAEFAGRPGRIDPGSIVARIAGFEPPVGLAAPVAGSAAHPAGPWALGTGLILLFLAALRSGVQAFGNGGR